MRHDNGAPQSASARAIRRARPVSPFEHFAATVKRFVLKEAPDVAIATPSARVVTYNRGGRRVELDGSRDIWWTLYRNDGRSPTQSATYDDRHTPEAARVVAANILTFLIPERTGQLP